MRKRFLAVLLLCTGCGLHNSLELPLPGDSQELWGSAREEILSPLRASSNPHSFRALLDTEISSHDRKEQFRQAVTFERPDRLRLEAFGAGLNQLLFLAVAEGGVLRAILPQDHQILFGPSNRKAVEYLLNIPLSADELMTWLTGGVLSAFQRFDHARVYGLSDGRFLVNVKDADGRELRLTGTKSMLPKFQEFSLTIAGEGVFRGTYEYAPGMLGFPARITFKIQDAEGKLLISRGELDPNLASSGGRLFQIPEPAGYSRIRIGD